MVRTIGTDAATMEEFVDSLGGIPLNRIRMEPMPGHATLEDAEKTRGCELIDGTLVEKHMGWHESFIASYIVRVLGNFVEEHDLGAIRGPDGGYRFQSRLMRMPDIAFVGWHRLPPEDTEMDAYPAIAPDLAIDVISPTNTKKEISRKRSEYFNGGVQRV